MPACGTLGFNGPSSAWCFERRVVVGEPDVDDRVEATDRRDRRFVPRRHHDIDLDRLPEQVGDAPAQSAPDAAEVHPAGRGDVGRLVGDDPGGAHRPNVRGPAGAPATKPAPAP